MTAVERDIVCVRCRSLLARRVGPSYGQVIAIRRKGVEVLTATVIAISCDCGEVWRPEQPTAAGVLADIETKAR